MLGSLSKAINRHDLSETAGGWGCKIPFVCPEGPNQRRTGL